jgi:integrase
MTRTTTNKPDKPYADFELFAHASGQWAKKINGRLHYFGTWDDWQGALDRYLDQRDYLVIGRTPPAQATSLADVLNQFLSDKKRSLDAGDIAQRTYTEYESVCDQIATLGKRRAFESLTYEDFSHLRSILGKGVNGQPVAVSSRKRLVGIARMVFNFANEELGFSVRYKKAMRPPAAKELRKANNIERLFTAEEVRLVRDDAKPQLKAMILLGINCGFGNADCGTLPVAALDLENGWHKYPRPKTEMPRRCPLWPETVAALRQVVNGRDSGLVFVTKYGNPWWVEEKQDPISYEFRKLVTKLGFYKAGVTTFYSLRRTFETIAATADVNQAVIDCIMGHPAHVSDMAAVYRQKVFDSQLKKCTDHVRDWVDGSISLN